MKFQVERYLAAAAVVMIVQVVRSSMAAPLADSLGMDTTGGGAAQVSNLASTQSNFKQVFRVSNPTATVAERNRPKRSGAKGTSSLDAEKFSIECPPGTIIMIKNNRLSCEIQGK